MRIRGLLAIFFIFCAPVFAGDINGPDGIRGFSDPEIMISQNFPDNVVVSTKSQWSIYRGKSGFMGANGPVIEYNTLHIEVKDNGNQRGFDWIAWFKCKEGFGNSVDPRGAVYYKGKIYLETWIVPCGDTSIHMWERTVFKGNPRVIAGYFTHKGDGLAWGKSGLPFYYPFFMVHEWSPVSAAEFSEALEKGDLIIIGDAKYITSKESYSKIFREHITDESAGTRMFDAVKENDMEKVKALIASDAGLVNITDESYNTPLHADLEYNYNGLIYQVLLKYGAEVNAVNISGETPLQVAVRWQNKAAITDLLAKGAKILYPSYKFLNDNMRLPIAQMLTSGCMAGDYGTDDGWAGSDAYQMWGFDGGGDKYNAKNDARDKIAAVFGVKRSKENPGDGKGLIRSVYNGEIINERAISRTDKKFKKAGTYVLYRIYYPGLKKLVKAVKK